MQGESKYQLRFFIFTMGIVAQQISFLQMCEEGHVQGPFLGCRGSLSEIQVGRKIFVLPTYKLSTYLEGIKAVFELGEQSEHIALFLDLGTSPFSEFPAKHVNGTLIRTYSQLSFFMPFLLPFCTFFHAWQIMCYKIQKISPQSFLNI
jgi:hypothetical protein